MSRGGVRVDSRVPPAHGRRNRIAQRAGLIVVALAIGVAIGLADSSPGWDSTGITAGGLFLAAAVVAFIGRDRPWLWALLVGLPTPILDTVRTGNTGSVLAVGFAAAGAAAGWALRRAG
jgi:hypothetical protein